MTQGLGRYELVEDFRLNIYQYDVQNYVQTSQECTINFNLWDSISMPHML